MIHNCIQYSLPVPIPCFKNCGLNLIIRLGQFIYDFFFRLKQAALHEFCTHSKPFVTNIRIFRGNQEYKGVSVESLDALNSAIQKISPISKIAPCDSKDIVPENWDSKSLLVLPGGKCSEWDELLSPSQQDQIHQWVLRGGCILGFCAGSYYCSELSEFQINPESILYRQRRIRLFSGICRGPVFSPQLQVVRIRWEETQKIGDVAVIGAGAFIPQNQLKDSSYQVLARFVDVPAIDSIAVVKCLKGKGMAILSTPHWEFGHEHLAHLEKLPALASKIDQMRIRLQNSAPFREECLRRMFTHCETVISSRRL